MAKKDLKSVAARLAPAARELPTQNVPALPERQAKPETPSSDEPQVQFSFGLRKSQRKELMRLASDADMTMRAFILNALKKEGLTVKPDDLQDLRRKG